MTVVYLLVFGAVLLREQYRRLLLLLGGRSGLRSRCQSGGSLNAIFWMNEVRAAIEIRQPELLDTFLVSVDALPGAKEKVFPIHSVPDVSGRLKAGLKPSQDLVGGYLRNLS